MGRSVFSQSWHAVADLRPRLSSNARIFRQMCRGQRWYVVQDKTSGRHHRLSPGAHAFVSAMDGQHTVQQLWELTCNIGGNDIPTQNDVVELLSQLHAQDLLHSSVTPDAAELLQRYRKNRRARWKQRLGNPLSIRVPLVDPDRFLTLITPRLTPLLSVRGIWIWLLTVAAALVIAVQRWSELTGNLSDRLLAADNLVLMALLFVPVKILHELGHGVVTKHFGGSVPEMGVMFLVFAPVPYVESSSATAFASKYERALVGAAGMIVETFIAAIATFVWSLAEPGLLRAMAFNVMVIAGISTLIVNGNPLLKFDGYYILVDLLEVPNLAQRGQRYWTYLCDRYLFGARTVEPPAETAAEKRWIAPYTILSWLYRALITISIILFVGTEFFVFGVLIALWSAFTLFIKPIYSGIKHILTGSSLRERRQQAVAIATGCTAVLLTFLAVVPVPLRTQAEGVVWLPERALLRSQANGFFERWLIEPGARVGRGELLAVLHDVELETEVAVTRARVQQIESEYHAEQFSNPSKAEILRERLVQEVRQLDMLEEKYARLIVASKAEGFLIVPELHDMPGRHFKRGELLGYVLNREELVARVVVDQDDVDLVRTRLQHAEIRVADRIEEVAVADHIREVPGGVEELPSAALSPAGGGRIQTDPQDPNGLKILERAFVFDLALPEDAAANTFGSRVYVRFSHTSEPLFKQWFRRLRQAFLSHFRV